MNAKGLDVRARVPGGYEPVEQAVRAQAAKLFKRGNVTVGLALDRSQETSAGYRVNQDLLQTVLALRGELAGDIADGTAEPGRPAVDPRHA